MTEDIHTSYPTLNKIKTIFHQGAMITIYEDHNGRVVLGGLGWTERFDWEEIHLSPTSTNGDEKE